MQISPSRAMPPRTTEVPCSSQNEGGNSARGGRSGGMLSAFVVVAATTMDGDNREQTRRQRGKWRNPNVEIRKNDEVRTPKPETLGRWPADFFRASGFGFGASSFFRHSSFVPRASATSSSASPPPRFKEMLKGLSEGVRRAEPQSVHAGALQGAVQLGQPLGVGIGKLPPHGGAA